ncbi:HipA family kinase [Pararhizobium sp. O133]|uniref:HipA family kinase n=1 Tax=Pararhizobium sp. O133 TaxID=3449278 RepID=UPI003F683554
MAIAPTQGSVPQLVALDAMFCGAANFGSEDTNEGCFCGDAGTFVIKKNNVHPALPHCEWFCSSLAIAVGVPQVPFSVIRHPDGNYWFGSQWMNGKTKDWWNFAAQGNINFGSLSEDLSRIYAFDLFIHNVDRHANNFMIVPEGNGHKVYSFDYSRSWLVNGFPPPAPMTNPMLATVNVRNWLKANFGDYIDINVAEQVLTSIEAIDATRVQLIIGSHPKDWLTQQEEDAIIDWWSSGMASARVAAIKTGLNDGTLI